MPSRDEPESPTMKMTPEVAALHRRSIRLYDALTRRMKKASATPAGSPTRKAFIAWRARVFFPLDRRLSPLLVKAGLEHSL